MAVEGLVHGLPRFFEGPGLTHSCECVCKGRSDEETRQLYADLLVEYREEKLEGRKCGT